MRIVVVGATGLVGAQVARELEGRGHDVLAASRSLGIDTLTGRGLAAALEGADVVVDASNSPTTEAGAALRFFEASTDNLLAAAIEAGVGHHLALSMVGVERLDGGYFHAKRAQEALIRAAGRPYTILRSTQFFEVIAGIVEAHGDQDTVRVAPAMVQPVASADVAAIVCELAVLPPACGTLEVAGPERHWLDALATMILTADEDPRCVVLDAHAHYLGGEVVADALLPGDRPRLAPTRFEDWLRVLVDS